MTEVALDPVFARLASFYDPAGDFTQRPAEWVAENSGEYTWTMQREVMQSVVDNRYTAVHSAHETGKSWSAARIAAWWISSHTPGDAFVVSTAPSAAQVSAVLWREINKIHRLAKLRGRINRAGYPQWFIDGELVGYGRKPADHEQSAFQGIHARYVLIIIDEACGVVKQLYDAIDSIAANDNARVLAIGNPDDETSYFAKICDPVGNERWNKVIRVDGLRTPNMTEELTRSTPLVRQLMKAEGIPFNTEAVPAPLREYLIHPSWVEERIHRWVGVGEFEQLDDEALLRRCSTSPLFDAKVRGVFPTTSSSGVIPLGWVQRAVERWRDWADAGQPEEWGRPGRRVVGVDVARGSGEGDESVLAIRQGDIVRELIAFHNSDTTETAEKAAQQLQLPKSMAVVDVIGIGAGVFDLLRRWNTSGVITATCIPFNAAGQSKRMDRLGEFPFRNDRAAAWWNMRELLDPSRGSQIALPDDEWLIQELVAPKYNHYINGAIVVEDKDEIRKRIGRSTDRADACLVAGTAVLTKRGNVPIEHVQRGDRVLTRDGWRRVLESGRTGVDVPTVTVETADGRTLRGTANHPVWDGERFKDLSNFTSGDTVLVCPNPSQSGSTESSSPGTPRASADTFASTTARTQHSARKAQIRFTARSGKRTTERSQLAATSTTKTTTRSTTRSKILRPSRRSNIFQSTVGKSRDSLAIVTGAASRWFTLAGISLAFGARAIATPSTTRATARTATPASATTAEPSLSATSEVRADFATVVVRRVFESARSDVYNLSVEGTPEFFANGVLVHNCVQSFWVSGMSTTEAENYAYKAPSSGDGVVRYEDMPHFDERDVNINVERRRRQHATQPEFAGMSWDVGL